MVRTMIVWLITQFFRLVHLTNPRLAGSSDLEDMKRGGEPFIAVAWHGQHLMAPFLMPRGVRFVAMFSKSKDAELNARVAERFGVEIVRGSGGRERARGTEKGGARALLVLKKALNEGKTAAMIADIPHGTPRELRIRGHPPGKTVRASYPSDMLSDHTPESSGEELGQDDDPLAIRQIGVDCRRPDFCSRECR